MYFLLESRLSPERQRALLRTFGNACNMLARVAGRLCPAYSSPDPSRIDVEEWLAQRDREASKLQTDTLWYAKAAFWGTISVGIVGIIVTIFAALFGK
jgi:hypothetical protein